MNDLRPYQELFDSSFPRYREARYREIRTLVDRYSVEDCLKTIRKPEFAEAVRYIQPLVAVRNYKTQVPFPEDIQAACELICQLKQLPIAEHELEWNGPSANFFRQLLNIPGFKLPTLSATFHFCHPDVFPIVDRYVEAACQLIAERCQDDFAELEVPLMPYVPAQPGPDYGEFVWARYKVFISFIRHARLLQEQEYGPEQMSFRKMDKALMVFGKNDGQLPE